MGRIRVPRSNVKALVDSVRARSLGQYLVTELQSRFDCAPEVARLLGQECMDFLRSTSRYRSPEEVTLSAGAGRADFSRRGERPRCEVRVSPIDTFEDLDALWEFGVSGLQNARAFRLVEEAYEQDGMFSAGELSGYVNLSPTSLMKRFQPLWSKGIQLPLRGQAKKWRRGDAVLRRTSAMREFLKGRRVSEISRELQLPCGSWQKMLSGFSEVVRGVRRGEASWEVAERTGLGVTQTSEWMELIEALGLEHARVCELESRHESWSMPEGGRPGDATAFGARIRQHYNFSEAEGNLLVGFLDEFQREFGGGREGGEFVYLAVACEEPAGKPLSECELVPVRLVFVEASDQEGLTPNQLCELKQRKIQRYATEVAKQGAYLTQKDLAFLLGTTANTIRSLSQGLAANVVPLRGERCDIGPTVSHKKRIVELYFQWYTETEISRRTHHSLEAIERYLKDFATVVILHERGLAPTMIRQVMRSTMGVVKAYLELYEQHQSSDFAFQMESLRRRFGPSEAEELLKKTLDSWKETEGRCEHEPAITVHC